MGRWVKPATWKIRNSFKRNSHFHESLRICCSSIISMIRCTLERRFSKELYKNNNCDESANQEVHIFPKYSGKRGNSQECWRTSDHLFKRASDFHPIKYIDVETAPQRPFLSQNHERNFQKHWELRLSFTCDLPYPLYYAFKMIALILRFIRLGCFQGRLLFPHFRKIFL